MPVLMEEIKQLIQKRGQIKARLTRFKGYFNSISDQQNLLQLKLRLAKCEDSWREFEDVQSLIELQDPTQDQLKERDEFESNYFDLMSEVEAFITTHVGNERTVSSSQTLANAAAAQIKLPTLNLPSFTGAYDEWLAFYDTFDSLIHSNPTLSSIQKFHYLKSALKASAAQVIHSLEISASNYETAWKLLRERYENKRWIIQSHTKALFEIPVLVRESHVGLRELLDHTLKHLRALKALKQPVEFWDTIIIHLTVSKLDQVTKREWETTLTGSEYASMDDFTRFLTHRCHLLEALDQGRTTTSRHSAHTGPLMRSNHHKTNQPTLSHVVASKPSCPICKQQHALFQCNTFLKLPIQQRVNKVKEIGICFNCLKGTHRSDQCTAGSCKQCSKKHNTLLHFNLADSGSPSGSKQNTTQSAVAGQDTMVSHHGVTDQPNQTYIILSTAMVDIYDNKGNKHSCRALLDSGSQSNFITESMCQQLGLKLSSKDVPITGIGRAIIKVSKSVQVTIKSRFNSFQASVTCLVLPRITENLPLVSFDIAQLEIPNNLRLADPHLGISSEINLLVGAELFYELLCVGQIKSAKNLPVLQKTQLGWVVSGGVGIVHLPQVSSCNVNVEFQMAKFWQLEEVKGFNSMSEEERACEDHFLKNFWRNSDGRFVVKMPLRSDVSMLGQSRDTALKRFYALEKRFQRQPAFKQQYGEFIREYIELDHMELIPADPDLDSNSHYYLPHHAVIKDSSSTTKLRVVFDASAETTSGLSLNNILMVGPTIQQDLFSLLTRFRTHQFVLTADIAKMYRQVLVDPSHTNLQRILWREASDAPVEAFRLKTVTYGTASAPFLATRCLRQMALDGIGNFPLAADVVLRDFYVDDLLTGANTLLDAQNIRDQLIPLLASCGLKLHKWASNVPELLTNLPHASTTCAALHINKDEVAKTLGLMWIPNLDVLQYTVKPHNSNRVTKRIILATIARIFDPLGLIGPVILRAKILMQRLWQVGLGWDESVPTDLHTAWVQYATQLAILNTLTIPRRVIAWSDAPCIQLHGFCDASEVAYGACLYVRSTNTQGISSVQLLCSKSRVAPLKNVSLPRLELCGAVLLAQLFQRVTLTLGLTLDKCYFWTDSTIVLAWLKSPSNNWKTFVANRISEIQSLTDCQDWNHIGTLDNPADHVSRGLLPGQLSSIESWWKGPPWLTSDSQDWPMSKVVTDTCCDPPEKRATAVTLLTTNHNSSFIDNYSSLTKLQRVTAYCLRFKTNSLSCLSDRVFGPLVVTELQRALDCLIKIVQRQEFNRELQILIKDMTFKSKDKMSSLQPFLDSNGILRVGGRIQHAMVPYAQRHPVLLPSKHHFTRLIVRHEHIRLLHAGPSLLLASLRTYYWPFGARSLVRHVVRNCTRCVRVKPATLEQVMGNLPSLRVSPSRPFTNCGVDYCGPYHLRYARRRGGRTFKTYISIFVCFSTKAVHLELVSDLTTSAFLGALKRFIARRGKCLHIYSDNATNFVGASGELAELYHLWASEEHQTSVNDLLAKDGISWHFIPPRSPHFGGIWEAAVKSAKHHLQRVAGNAALTFEEMMTLIVQVEACLNSRPLTPISDNPEDISVLTPGHFLIGEALTAIAEPSLTALPANKLSHWQRVQQLTQHFWSRWSKEYLSQLQQRSKWKTSSHVEITPGVMVILKDENLPPLKWQLGRVVELHPGPDGHVRVISVKTARGLVRRAIARVSILPMEGINNG